jgi:hypothetical protein
MSTDRATSKANADYISNLMREGRERSQQRPEPAGRPADLSRAANNNLVEQRAARADRPITVTERARSGRDMPFSSGGITRW